MSSPKLYSKKGHKLRIFKVLILGQSGVGKTALIVRFATKRFIFDYVSTLEKKYTVQTEVAGEIVRFEIQDIADQNAQAKGGLPVEEHIKWADAILLMFSTTDSCSFNECTRLRFLINCTKKHKFSQSKVSGNLIHKETVVMLIGNKKDLQYDRMVSYTEAKAKGEELGCSRYFEISVKESVEESWSVFGELFKQYNMGFRHQISSDDLLSSPETIKVRRFHSHATMSDMFQGEYMNEKEIKRKIHRRIIKKVMPSLKPRSSSDDN